MQNWARGGCSDRKGRGETFLVSSVAWLFLAVGGAGTSLHGIAAEKQEAEPHARQERSPYAASAEQLPLPTSKSPRRTARNFAPPSPSNTAPEIRSKSAPGNEAFALSQTPASLPVLAAAQAAKEELSPPSSLPATLSTNPDLSELATFEEVPTPLARTPRATVPPQQAALIRRLAQGTQPVTPREPVLLEEQPENAENSVRQKADIAIKPMGAIAASTTPPRGVLPKNAALSERHLQPEVWQSDDRHFRETAFFWEPTNYAYQPLYFEEPNLERYGYDRGCLQPVFSAGHFYGSVALWPYKLVCYPWYNCESALGHYRPGSCVPYRCHHLPFRWDALLVEAGAWTGLAFLMP